MQPNKISNQFFYHLLVITHAGEVIWNDAFAHVPTVNTEHGNRNYDHENHMEHSIARWSVNHKKEESFKEWMKENRPGVNLNAPWCLAHYTYYKDFLADCWTDYELFFFDQRISFGVEAQ